MGLEALTEMDYPGRFIILGKNEKGVTTVVYGITGRSDASRARRMVYDAQKQHVLVVPTDAKVNEGDVSLLIYPAIMHAYQLVVTNGAQTKDIAMQIQAPTSPADVMKRGLESWSFEPDAPHFTPRINGCMVRSEAGFSIIKRGSDGSRVAEYFTVPLVAGMGKLLATYNGENVNPLPSFAGAPRDVHIAGTTAKECASEAYGAIKNPAFRVAVAAVQFDLDRGKRTYIVNAK